MNKNDSIWVLTISTESKDSNGELKISNVEYFFKTKLDCVKKIQNTMFIYDYIETPVEFQKHNNIIYHSAKKEDGDYVSFMAIKKLLYSYEDN